MWRKMQGELGLENGTGWHQVSRNALGHDKGWCEDAPPWILAGPNFLTPQTSGGRFVKRCVDYLSYDACNHFYDFSIWSDLCTCAAFNMDDVNEDAPWFFLSVLLERVVYDLLYPEWLPPVCIQGHTINRTVRYLFEKWMCVYPEGVNPTSSVKVEGEEVVIREYLS